MSFFRFFLLIIHLELKVVSSDTWRVLNLIPVFVSYFEEREGVLLNLATCVLYV